MGVEFNRAAEQIHSAAANIFSSDPRVRSLGIGRHESGFGYIAVRNASLVVPEAAEIRIAADFQNIPVAFLDSHRDPESLVKVPHSGPGSPTVASLVPVQARSRALVCGLQTENFDDDQRTGVIAGGHLIVGTLGCFVNLAAGVKAILSNNHVVAG